MKRFLLALLVSISFVACKKDNAKPAVSIEGKWVGKFGTGGNPPSSFFSFNIKPGGVIQELNQDGEVTGEGEWELDSNNVLFATYETLSDNVKVYTVIGAFNAGQAKILGNWGYNDSATDGGTWEMSKQ
ncbi:MAG: hypothetical protein ACTHLE_03660 [Agriterribacter sp.]